MATCQSHAKTHPLFGRALELALRACSEAESVSSAALKLMQATQEPSAEPLHIVAGIAIFHHGAKADCVLLSRLLPWVLWHALGQAITDPSHRGLVQKDVGASTRLVTGVFAPEKIQPSWP